MPPKFGTDSPHSVKHILRKEFFKHALGNNARNAAREKISELKEYGFCITFADDRVMV